MIRHLFLAFSLCAAGALAADPELAEKIEQHQNGSRKLSDEQDELSADVQQIAIEETSPEVIELFRQVEDAMAEASGRLLRHDTGGESIAAETEVIEKIHEAAKKRQQQSSGGQGSAMMDMLERMLGMEPGREPKEGEGQEGGQGQTGDSDSGNRQSGGANEGNIEERRVPKKAGLAGKTLPPEFHEALKAYNRALGAPRK